MEITLEDTRDKSKIRLLCKPKPGLNGFEFTGFSAQGVDIVILGNRPKELEITEFWVKKNNGGKGSSQSFSLSFRVCARVRVEATFWASFFRDRVHYWPGACQLGC